jgi:oligopeptidase B
MVWRAALAFLLCLPALSAGEADAGRRPPMAERKSVTTRNHGIMRTDDYAWLMTARFEDVMHNSAALESTIATHLAAETSYVNGVLAPNRALERRLLAQMRARMHRRDRSVPDAWGAWQYYTRYNRGSQRVLHCRQPRDGGTEQVLLDENTLAAGRRSFSVDDTAVSPDHRRIAYSIDEDGAEHAILRIRDLASGRDLADTIDEIRGGFAWSTDAQWLFYVRRDPVKWARSVFRHRIGMPTTEDQLVYEETQEGFTVSLRPSLSGRFLVIEASDFSSSDLKLLDLAQPLGAPRAITARKVGVKSAVADLGQRLILVTNADGAIGWKIGEKALSDPPDAPLRKIVAHVAGRLIEDVIVYRDYLTWLERDMEKGKQRILVRRWSDGAEQEIAFGEQPAKVELLPGLEQDTRALRYAYQSMVQPRQVFDYDMETRQRTLRKVQDVPSGHDPGRYVTRAIDAPAADGVGIPVTLLYRKNTPLDGSAPLWLYGYGAYGETQYPEFGIERLSLVDRGFIYGIAHVRGGGEKGEAWHDAGRLGNKLTSITDFIAVAEHLIRSGLTGPGRIVASGASAGGTLVGAVANMRPELFGALYLEAPFVDALNSLLDRTQPLTEASFSEFGNPIEARADFLTLQSYAPYENVRAQAYPPMLVVQSLNDQRVPYWEAVKWVAKLREKKTDGNAIALVIKARGGHGGGSGRFDALKDYARAYAFALRLLVRDAK